MYPTPPNSPRKRKSSYYPEFIPKFSSIVLPSMKAPMRSRRRYKRKSFPKTISNWGHVIPTRKDVPYHNVDLPMFRVVRIKTTSSP